MFPKHLPTTANRKTIKITDDDVLTQNGFQTNNLYCDNNKTDSIPKFRGI